MLKRSLNLIEDEKLLRSKILDLTRKYVEKFGKVKHTTLTS